MSRIRKRMRAWWRPDGRRGFALGWVGVMLLLLMIVAGALWYVSSATRANVARATAGQAYMDLCLSALNEATVTLRDSVEKGEPFQGHRMEDLLARHYPFGGFDVDPVETRKIQDRLFKGATLSAVTIKPVGRNPPGEQDPLLGMIEATVKATGDLGGAASGRLVTYRLFFQTPCSVVTVASDKGSYMRIHWGIPRLQARPLSVHVERL